MAILVAIDVYEDGYREVIGAAEGMKEDKASWLSFMPFTKDIVIQLRNDEGSKIVKEV